MNLRVYEEQHTLRIIKAILRAITGPAYCEYRPRTRAEICEESQKYTNWQQRNGYLL